MQAPIDFSKIKLVTSNEQKLREFCRFGLDLKIEKGVDLPEVNGGIMDVMLHKAIAAGENLLVEDTILAVEGKEIVDIRFKINEVVEKYSGMEATWITSLCVLYQDNLYLYTAETDGKIDSPAIPPDGALGFDSYFYPVDNNPGGLSLHQLELKGVKDDYSARKKAVDCFINNKKPIITPRLIVPDWKGGYQNSV